MLPWYHNIVWYHHMIQYISYHTVIYMISYNVKSSYMDQGSVWSIDDEDGSIDDEDLWIDLIHRWSMDQSDP